MGRVNGAACARVVFPSVAEQKRRQENRLPTWARVLDTETFGWVCIKADTGQALTDSGR